MKTILFLSQGCGTKVNIERAVRGRAPRKRWWQARNDSAVGVFLFVPRIYQQPLDSTILHIPNCHYFGSLDGWHGCLRLEAISVWTRYPQMARGTIDAETLGGSLAWPRHCKARTEQTIDNHERAPALSLGGFNFQFVVIFPGSWQIPEILGICHCKANLSKN